jgi:ribonuclease HII
METPQTAASIAQRFRHADEAEFAVLERSFAADTRKTVQAAMAAARKRLDALAAERERVSAMYALQREIAKGGVCVGLDEVGRGPLAGPLAVGAVVLPETPLIGGLNDSKQVKPGNREALAARIREHALAWTVCYVEPCDIDAAGMGASLRVAFTRAIREIEAQGIALDAILLDGSPLHLDVRERSIVKGDAKCASIAAASIVAKVARDELMVQYDREYPQYGFAANKGYGSTEHQRAIREHGLCPIHRASFCSSLLQDTLF